MGTTAGGPAYRYTAAVAAELEPRWQRYWEEHGCFHAPNPVGPLADARDRPTDDSRQGSEQQVAGELRMDGSRQGSEQQGATPRPPVVLDQDVASRPFAARPLPQDKLFVQDMFPYPSGAGLHVGHPLGFIGTDVFARYHRMLGRNVLHTMGFDAFGLPAEQYAVQTGQHPRVTTEQNIERYRRCVAVLCPSGRR